MAIQAQPPSPPRTPSPTPSEKEDLPIGRPRFSIARRSTLAVEEAPRGTSNRAYKGQDRGYRRSGYSGRGVRRQQVSGYAVSKLARQERKWHEKCTRQTEQDQEKEQTQRCKSKQSQSLFRKGTRLVEEV
ncbi:hypothetical protein RSAG8_08232, partial [Rhizoctonia solani AG-8 WAC10335]